MSFSRSKQREYSLEVGDYIGDRFKIRGYLGSGWEGEVYLITETATGIDRSAKIFFPERNRYNKTAVCHALKLHRARSSNSLVQYLFQENIVVDDKKVTCLISEYIQGEVLDAYLVRQRGKRIPTFEALHIVKSIAQGLAPLHAMGEYHGDLHASNIIINRKGLNFDIKMLDPFDWKDSKRLNIKKDINDLVRILYDLCGGKRFYGQLPKEVKYICCGLKNSLVSKKFPDATRLLAHLNNFDWAN